MPLALGMFMDVFFGKAGKEDAVEAGVESVEVGTAHVADTWLGLENINKKNQKVIKTNNDFEKKKLFKKKKKFTFI